MYKVIHLDCGKIAWYHKRKLEVYDVIDAENVINLNGSQPNSSDPCICQSCGHYFHPYLTNIKQIKCDTFHIKK